MRIWLLEDDPVQAPLIQNKLRDGLPEAEIKHIKTEHEFLQSLEDAATSPPDLAIVDVMLPWTQVGISPGGEPVVEPPPPNYNGFYRAGIRCVQALHARPVTRSTPVILLTVLTAGDLAADLEDLRSTVSYLNKREPPERLVKLVQKLLRPTTA